MRTRLKLDDAAKLLRSEQRAHYHDATIASYLPTGVPHVQIGGAMFGAAQPQIDS